MKYSANPRPFERKQPAQPLPEGDKGRKFEPFYIAALGHDRRTSGRTRRFDEKR